MEPTTEKSRLINWLLAELIREQTVAKSVGYPESVLSKPPTYAQDGFSLENIAVRTTLSHIACRDGAQLTQALHAAGLRLVLLNNVASFEVLNDLTEKMRDGGYLPDENRNIFECLIQFFKSQKPHVGKADEKRQQVLQVAKPLCEQGKSRKQVVAEIVQTFRCSERTAQKYVDELVKTGEIEASWPRRSYNANRGVSTAKSTYRTRTPH